MTPTPGDTAILHRDAPAVTVAEVDGVRFCYFITPGGAPIWASLSDILQSSDGPEGVAKLKARVEAVE